MNIKALHNELITELEKFSGNGTQHTGNVAYLGSTHTSYHISNPIKHAIVKDFVKQHKDISQTDFVDLLTVLYLAPSYDEKSLASMLLGSYHAHRAKITPKQLHLWLEHLEGWAEIDGLCQSNFTAQEMLASWDMWEPLLIEFSQDTNIVKRRASIVLLTGPVAHSSDPRLSSLSFENIDRLKHEKDILITKAISWLLRSMVKHYKKDVMEYLENNKDTLPKIATRETQRKILTGRK